MLNKNCTFYPCHKGIEDCKYCYCPIYPCGYEEFGKFVISHESKKVWDCSDCVVFHKKKIIDLMHGLNGKFKKDIEEHVADK
jgi:Zn-finger protein